MVGSVQELATRVLELVCCSGCRALELVGSVQELATRVLELVLVLVLVGAVHQLATTL